MKKEKLIELVEGALMAAMAIVLNFFKLDIGAEGGSVNLVFIPLMVYALRWGTMPGIAVGLVFGTLKAVIGGGISYGWQSLLLDYSIAFGLVGLSGLMPHRPVLSTAFGALGCLFSFVLSGVIIWGEYMPSVFWGMDMTNVWIYSLIYNGSFTAVNWLIAAVVIEILANTTKLLQRQGSAKKI